MEYIHFFRGLLYIKIGISFNIKRPYGCVFCKNDKANKDQGDDFRSFIFLEKVADFSYIFQNLMAVALKGRGVVFVTGEVWFS